MGTGSKKQSSRRRSSAGSKSSAAGENTGRWTEEECDKFEEGLKKFGKQWQLIAKEIPSRTIVQIRTHAQKHFLRLAKSQPEISTSIAHVEEAAQTQKKVSNTPFALEHDSHDTGPPCIRLRASKRIHRSSHSMNPCVCCTGVQHARPVGKPEQQRQLGQSRRPHWVFEVRFVPVPLHAGLNPRGDR